MQFIFLYFLVDGSIACVLDLFKTLHLLLVPDHDVYVTTGLFQYMKYYCLIHLEIYIYIYTVKHLIFWSLSGSLHFIVLLICYLKSISAQSSLPCSKCSGMRERQCNLHFLFNIAMIELWKCDKKSWDNIQQGHDLFLFHYLHDGNSVLIASLKCTVLVKCCIKSDGNLQGNDMIPC